MHTQWLRTMILAGALVPWTGWAALSPAQREQLPPPATQAVDFVRDVQPILETSCVKCHGRGKSKGGFRLDDRASFLQGGESGPAVVLGRSAESYLIALVSGMDPDNVMPEKGTKLTPVQVGLLRGWIDQGLKWEAGVSFAKLPPVNLHAPRPSLPVGRDALGSRNSIDLLLEGHRAKHGVVAPAVVEDRTFARRVYLDVVGLLPTPEELGRFLADSAPDKRERLVRELLRDADRYATHWLSFWNDLLRNDYKGTGYIDGGRKQITSWLYASLALNKPYDRFVAELINPTPESEGFTKGIVWRGEINASQKPHMQAAQTIAQVFMGVNLKCASCHDSFINDWTLADAYGLASVYADGPLELVHCDKPTGQPAPLRFIYPELGAIPPNLPKADRLRRLAEIVTQSEDGRLTRTLVNRLWARLLGRGLVEPVDEMESPAWHPELLDWLAADLAANGYNVKKTIERILTSEAYQLPAVPVSETTTATYVFRGPLVRRMSAEQFVDAVAAITGEWAASPSAQADFDLGLGWDPASRPQWVWSHAGAASEAPPGTNYFRRDWILPAKPVQAAAAIVCDNGFKLWINGREAGSGKDVTKPTLVDLREHLVAGTNRLALQAVNDSAAPDKKDAKQSNPAGWIGWFRVAFGAPEVPGQPTDVRQLVSDASWSWVDQVEGEWERTEMDPNRWGAAVVLGEMNMGPWQVEKRLREVASSFRLQGATRSALVPADAVMVALGRPNREQVMSARATAATTLQGLELTNGASLAERLKKGSERWQQAWTGRAPDEVVRRLYLRSLGRLPTAGELALAVEHVGQPVRADGVEDVLWAMLMLPEFQLIH